MNVTEMEWRQVAERNFPDGKTSRRMKIVSCRNPEYWYNDMVGREIDIHYFCTFGAWDTKGRWLLYYDLRDPTKIQPEVTYGRFVRGHKLVWLLYVVLTIAVATLCYLKYFL